MAAAPSRAIALMFHDVVTDGAFGSSGFPGEAAAIYKLDRTRFALHLSQLGVTPGLIVDPDLPRVPVFLTFDDGGVSALTNIAPMLEERGWRGHFFITTDRVGTPGFLTRDQVRELASRGHVVGSHSCSHPRRISTCDPVQLRHEWVDSVRALEDWTGVPVTTASVPGGFYSDAVGQTAADAGIRVLFTSEPTTRVSRRGDCLLVGRYGIWRDMPAHVSGAIARGALVPRLKQSSWWTVKKLAKAIPGDPYAKLRALLLSRGQ
jgi:peptidoglycan/xylan/chitin deacetylase (PgdA/CDA1 family)